MEIPTQSQSLTQTESQIKRQIVIESYTDPMSGKRYELNAVEHSQYSNYIEKIEITAVYDQDAKRITIYPEYIEGRLYAVDIYVREIIEGESWVNLEARIVIMKNSLPYFLTIRSLRSAIMVKELPRVLKDILGFLNQAFNAELRL